MNDEPITGEVIGGTIHLNIPATSALVVGPDEVVIFQAPYGTPTEALLRHAKEIETALPRDRYLVISGEWNVTKVHKDDLRRALDDGCGEGVAHDHDACGNKRDTSRDSDLAAREHLYAYPPPRFTPPPGRAVDITPNLDDWLERPITPRAIEPGQSSPPLDGWSVKHPGIGFIPYPNYSRAVAAAGTAGTLYRNGTPYRDPGQDL